MDEKAFLEEMENLLEMDPGSLALDNKLKSLEKWDSLAFVSFLAIADATYGVKILPDQLRKAETLADVMSLTGS